MSIDFESLKDKAVVAAQTGVTRVKELTETGVAKAKELADTGAAKAKEITEIGKLKVNNSAEQEAIRKAYSDACQRITDSLARISYNNERIADIKAAGQLSDGEVEAAEVEPEPVCEEPSCCCGGEEKDEGPCCCCEQDEDKPQE